MPQSQPTVLLIEDDSIAVRVISAILRSSHQVVPLPDPRQLEQTLGAFQVLAVHLQATALEATA